MLILIHQYLDWLTACCKVVCDIELSCGGLGGNGRFRLVGGVIDWISWVNVELVDMLHQKSSIKTNFSTRMSDKLNNSINFI